MDAELIAIGRVRRAVKGLTDEAQVRVLNYVVAGMYEAERAKQQAAQERQGMVPPHYGGGASSGQLRQTN